jgi:GTP-binding protein
LNFNNAKYSTSYGVISQLPPSKAPEVAFAGRSNVGKSSLLNALLNRRALAKVSAKPGKTATINFFDVDGIDFVDLPGYGYAKVAKDELDRWADLIEGYFNQPRNFALAVSLIDIRHDPSELDHTMIEFLQDMELPYVVVLTKADKLSKQKAMSQKRTISKQLNLSEEVPVLVTSSEKKQGLEDLRKLIIEHVERLG